MYAIVEIAGQQLKVEKNQEIFVHRLEEKEGAKITFTEILLLDDNGKITVGKPYVEDMAVSAKILAHVKGDKVTVFHKKRRKGYQKLNGHRQSFSKIQIEGIAKTVEDRESAAEKKAAEKKDTVAEKAVTTAKKTSAAKKTTATKEK